MPKVRFPVFPEDVTHVRSLLTFSNTPGCSSALGDRVLRWLGRAAASLFVVTTVFAEAVQELTGHLEAQDIAVFSLPSLQQGHTLYARAEGTFGNLDPFLALVQLETLLERIAPLLTPAHARTPVDVISERLATAPLLAWSDDAGGQHAATLEIQIPAAGDYRLLVTSTPAQRTFGDYRLLIGLDTPAVLAGTAEPSGPPIARPESVHGALRSSLWKAASASMQSLQLPR